MERLYPYGHSKCPLAPKIEYNFLIFKLKTEGYHYFELMGISKFTLGSEHYVLHGKCKYCDKHVEKSFVTYEDLLRKGLSKDFLNSVTTSICYINN